MFTIFADAQYSQKIKHSRFIGHARHIENPDQAKAFLTEIHKTYPDATHHCPAYIIGKTAQTQFCSDAGEPSGTAGRPILSALLRNEFTNIALVVTRYYGGVQLGIPGLIEAYGSVAEQTIALCEKVSVVEYIDYMCIVPYPLFDTFTHKLKIEGVVVKNTEYTDVVRVLLEVTEFAENSMIDVLMTFENNIMFDRYARLR